MVFMVFVPPEHIGAKGFQNEHHLMFAFVRLCSLCSLFGAQSHHKIHEKQKSTARMNGSASPFSFNFLVINIDSISKLPQNGAQP